MHPESLNAEPALFPLLLHCLYPDHPSSTLLSPRPDPVSRDLAKEPKNPPILWHSLCHTPSFATARSRGGGNQSVICTAALQTDRPLLALQHWVFLLRGRHRLPPGAGISLQRYLRDQHDSRPSQASQARRLTSPGYLFALVSPSPPKSASPARRLRLCACHTPLPPQEGKRACAARNLLAVFLFLTQFATKTIMTVNPSSSASPSRRVIRWVLTP